MEHLLYMLNSHNRLKIYRMRKLKFREVKFAKNMQLVNGRTEILVHVSGSGRASYCIMGMNLKSTYVYIYKTEKKNL